VSDLLPANATEQERDISLAIQRHADLPVPVRDVWNPDTCPADLLAWLSWAWSVDVWDPAWSELQKREAIKASLNIHRYKGTIGAVREALTVLFYQPRVQEWFNQVPPGAPYTFRLLMEADQQGITQEAALKLFEVVERTKNLRSHLDAIQVSARTTAGPKLAVCTGVGSAIQVTQYVWSPVICNETTICF
jgi:phage tail P2-like protein